MTVANWVEEELGTVDLKHKRRNSRLKRLVSDLAAMPAASIPAAVGGGHAETTAAYRFFDNPNVEFDAILAPHREATLARIRQHKSVILIQDTTEIDVTRPEQQVAETGPLDQGARRGFFVHPLIALSTEGVPLGTLSAHHWSREDSPPLTETKPKKKTKEQAKKDKAARDKLRKSIPIEDKESLRWVTTLQEAHAVAAQIPDTEMIVVADSESDIYEYIDAGQSVAYEANEDEAGEDADAASTLCDETPPKTRAQWIVRGCQDRALCVAPGSDSDAATSLSEALEAGSVLTTYEVSVRGREQKVDCETRGRRQARQSRQAIVEVRSCAVVLRAPYRPDRKLPDVPVNAVLVREIAPPEGEEPIEWLLLTSLPITTTEEVLRVIQTYCLRWMIEIYFRVLKQGCRIEWRRFEHLDRLTRYLAVALLVSWRTLYVTRLGREFPDLDCEAVFEASEWKAVYQVTQKQTPPETPPKLQEMVRMVAQLGGYVNRPRSDEPGSETIWKGLQRMHDMALCWDLFGPGNLEKG